MMRARLSKLLCDLFEYPYFIILSYFDPVKGSALTPIPAKRSSSNFLEKSLSLKLYRTSWSPFSKGRVIWSKNNSNITIHCHDSNKEYGCIHIQISHSKHYLATIISHFDFCRPRKNLFWKCNFLRNQSQTSGYIDVGDEYWRWNVLATTLRCWWRFRPFLSLTSSIF